MRTSAGKQASLRQEAGARILTTVYALATIVSIFLVLLLHSSQRRPTAAELALGVVNVPAGRTLVSLVVLALITRALLGRKRVALWLVAFFQAIGAYFGVLSLLGYAGFAFLPDADRWQAHSDLSKSLDIVSLVVAVLALWWLWSLRPSFPGRLQPGSRRSAALVAVVGLLTTPLLAWFLLRLSGSPSEGPRIVRVILVALGDPDIGGTHGVPSWVFTVVSLLVGMTIILTVAAFLRSARPPSGWTPDREIHIRRLLAAYGEEDSLGYFATRRDKSSVFSPDGEAAVTYRVIGGVSLASGDPVGRRDSWAAAIAAWRAEAREFGWVPAVLSASEAGAASYAAQGFRLVLMGDEAILDTHHTDLRTAALTPVRRAASRVARAGVTITVRRQGDLTDAELHEVVARAEAWRGDEPDRGFSMALNRDADPADTATLVVTARTGDGALVGLLTFVPWGRRGASLDLMRRSPQAPNGITEAMVASVLGESERLGIRRISLNFCMFRGIYADAQRLGSSPVTRINYSVLGFLDRFWQLERLYVSNEKYHPTWVPRFLCFEHGISMPQVAIAAGVGEGFLPHAPWTGHPGAGVLDAEHLAQLRALVSAPAVDIAGLAPRRSDQTRHRLAHLTALRERGIDPYPAGGGEPTSPGDPTAYPSSGEASTTLTGRLVTIRDHGGVVFADVADGARRTQVLLERALVGETSLATFTARADIGDIVRFTGAPGSSHNGTPSLVAETWTMQAKSLQPVPFSGFSNPQARLRRRSTDLIVHPEVGALIRDRSTVVRSVRRTLDDAGFLEVETPMLHPVHGGASARPFETWINAYGTELFLRIAPELYLKRLVVGGMGPIYELGRSFRNEGADATHNPEFTSLEVYQPYADYTTMRVLTERIVKAAATALHGAPLIPLPAADRVRGGLDGVELVEVTAPWPVVPMLDAVSQRLGRPVDLDTDIDELLGLATAHGIEVRGDMGPGAILEELYGELVEPATRLPTFYTDFPIETSPLTRPHRTTPGLVERWDLVVAGMELGTAYSELTDPVDQRERLTAQSLKAAAGDPEAMAVDEDFLHALEVGMPPTGGLGIGVDRLVMLLTNTAIRDVLTFPFVKPHNDSRRAAAEAGIPSPTSEVSP